MPLTSYLAAPGSLLRLAGCATRLTRPAPLAAPHQRSRFVTRTTCSPRHRHVRYTVKRPAQDATGTAAPICPARPATRCYSDINPAEADLLTFENLLTNASESTDGALATSDASRLSGQHDEVGHVTKQRGSMRRKKQRPSRPATVLQSIQGPARNLYRNPAIGKVDLSHRRPGQVNAGRLQRHNTILLPTSEGKAHVAQPVSLYTILARYLDHHTGPLQGSPFAFTALEQDRLHRAKFTEASVERWATCLVEPKSAVAAASAFEYGNEIPPLFVLMLFLRRQHMSAAALSVVLRHVDQRVKPEPLEWAALKILSVRLLRHARMLWPEAIPSVSSIFVAQASTFFTQTELDTTSARTLSDLTRFCNIFLLLLSLPASVHPVLSALHQEQAQFQVLQFMASHVPAIAVNRRGFRAASRNQLARPKTTLERDWAELKGPSWPPWKEDRTAMDEHKGYDYGASRASKIIHRMYEAGYRGRKWEEMVEVYAGWDTDSSPTIQIRTSLPHLSSQARNEAFLNELLWAARVRATRTRREAWACFLACEASGTRASQHVYLAMLEKLYYAVLERPTKKKTQSDLDRVLKVDEEDDDTGDNLLPGDMKEVVADPTSPLHYAYLSEPMPTFTELCDRMYKQNIRPSHRLLAFLLEVTPTFEAGVELLDKAKSDFRGGIGHLLSGYHGDNSSISTVPGYMLTAIIIALCRYGHFYRTPQKAPQFESPQRHATLFLCNKHYLLEYVHALLMYYRPHHQPAWAAFMGKVIWSNLHATTYNHPNEPAVKGRGVTQYIIIWKLVDAMEEIDLDVDDKIFSLVCTATAYAAQAVSKGTTSVEGARHVLRTASPRLRKMFHGLVGAHKPMHFAGVAHNDEDSEIVRPHIPGPSELHAYIRALGMLRDYEGLYSFSTWLTTHQVEVTARAEAQHSGSNSLFRMLVALRAAVTGHLGEDSSQDSGASDDIVQLIKAQIDSVDDWGGWPGQGFVDLYLKGRLKGEAPKVDGR